MDGWMVGSVPLRRFPSTHSSCSSFLCVCGLVSWFAWYRNSSQNWWCWRPLNDDDKWFGCEWEGRGIEKERKRQELFVPVSFPSPLPSPTYSTFPAASCGWLLDAPYIAHLQIEAKKCCGLSLGMCGGIRGRGCFVATWRSFSRINSTDRWADVVGGRTDLEDRGSSNKQR